MTSEVPCLVCDETVVTGDGFAWVAVTRFAGDRDLGSRIGTIGRMHVDCVDEAAGSGWVDAE